MQKYTLIKKLPPVVCFFLLLSFSILHPSLSYADITDSLRVAIINADLEGVRQFLQNGADPNTVYHDQSTPLFEAVNKSAGSTDIIRLLLQYGADPSKKAMGTSIVSAAVKTNNEDLIRLLSPYAVDEGEFYDLAVFHRDRKEENAALDYADKVLKINPSSHDAWALKGTIYASQRRVKDAEIAYQHAFEYSLSNLKTDKSADSYTNTLWYAVLSSHFTEALRIGKEGLSLYPDDDFMTINIGHALLLLGNKNEAIALYKKSYIRFHDPGRFGDQASQQFLDDFSYLKERYPDKILLVTWAEKRLFEPFDFAYGEIPFGAEKDAVLALVEDADVSKEGPPIIGSLDPYFKKEFGEGLYAFDVKSRLSEAAAEKYSVVYPKWDTIDRIDLFFTNGGRGDRWRLFMVSKLFKPQQGKAESVFNMRQEDISKELNVQPAVHSSQITSQSGALPGMIAIWKIKEGTVILDVFSESNPIIRSRIFFIFKKGLDEYHSMIQESTTLKK